MTPRLWSDSDNSQSALGNDGQRGGHSENSQMSPLPYLNNEGSNARVNLYALTIGINEYKSTQYRKLSGCLADAEGIEKYLQMALSVPRSNIKSLRNSGATRAAILEKIEAFIRNPEIQRDDPILIYFAGHGAATESPAEWIPRYSSTTQMLIPYDCGTEINRKVVHGIPDRTLGCILRRLADEKGNNITVILDNCFSGSGTRGTQPNKYALRGVDYRLQLPVDLDAEYTYHGVCPTRGINVASGFLNAGFKSHVLISACGAHEQAREHSNHGVFTEALLNALWKAQRSIERLAYNDLLSLLGPLPGPERLQNPQCEGDEQHRYVFSAKVPYRPRITYTGFKKYNILALKAGYAHGITPGSRLLIWKNLESHLREETPVAEVSISEVIDAYNSEARALSGFLDGSSFVAQRISSGDKPELRIHVRDEACTQLVRDAITQLGDNPMKPILSPIVIATVVISTDQDRIYFEIIDPDINRHGLKRLPDTIPANVIDLRRTIHAISHYQYQLRFPRIQETDEAAFFAKNVSIEIFKAKVYKPLDEPPSVIGDNLNVDGKGIDLEIDESPQVIILRNNTNHDIYPALFYFESIDLSITPIYRSPTAGYHNKVDPPLPAHQTLTVGYAGDGGVPHVFEIGGSRFLEIGFFKLYIMSQAVDLSDLAQKSPFENTRSPRPYVPKNRFDFFHTIVVPVVVRKNPSSDQVHTSRPKSNTATRVESLPASYPSPPIFRSMWNRTFKSSIKINVGIRSANVPDSSPHQRQNTSYLDLALFERLEASMNKLEVVDKDLKAIEEGQQKGMKELKELGYRIALIEERASLESDSLYV